MTVAGRASLPVDALELRAARQSSAARAPRFHLLRRPRFVARRPQAESRLRPLSRRRFNVSRPARELMRARNPGHGPAFASSVDTCASSSLFSARRRHPPPDHPGLPRPASRACSIGPARRRYFSRQLRAASSDRRRALGIVARPGPRVLLRIVPSGPLGEERIVAAVSRDLEHIWSRVQAHLALVVDEPTYRIWLEPLRASSSSTTASSSSPRCTRVVGSASASARSSTRASSS